MSIQSALDEYLSRLTTLQPEAIADLFADPVDFYVPGAPEVPWTGKRRTRIEVLAFFRILSENLTIESFRVDGKFVTENAAVVVGDFASRFSKSGKPFRSPFMLRLEFHGDEILRYLFLEDTYAATKAFAPDPVPPAKDA
jgi:uncharacterized protein